MLPEEVRTAIEEVIGETNSEAFIVEMKMKRGPKTTLLIKVDTDKGITMTECTTLSRAVSWLLEEKDYFDFAYTLELTSPGVGNPLILHRQYIQNIGRHLQVKLADGNEMKGKLEAVEEEYFMILPLKKKLSKSQRKKLKGKIEEPKETKIEFSDILEAKVIII
ncbi:MAG: ribosome assembly cofactor RimP [Bacteroidia bacterium]|nr:ribosome assembly cofactor RimP [Bacteroidia bacterium]